MNQLDVVRLCWRLFRSENRQETWLALGILGLGIGWVWHRNRATKR